MFWRSRKEKEKVEETDDLAKLQKQFGITPVQDADVQAELQALLAATGGGLSPKDETLELLGQDEDDEEARILRELQLDGVTLVDDESDGHEAESELRGMLQEVHETARASRRREEKDMTPAQPQKSDDRARIMDRDAQVHALKVEAVELKRQGRIQEALAKFREAKQLQEKSSGGGASGLRTAVVTRTEETVQSLVETAVDDGEHGVEVTDEDMQDPEFLAQLATMGLTEEKEESTDTESTRYHDVMQQLSALETQIHECKVHAVQLKRQNRIAEALSCMREMKELEAKRGELRSSPVLSSPAPAIQKLSVPQVTESVAHITAVDTSNVVRSNSGVGESGFDSDSGSIEDVEVTAEDMNDPAFTQELQNLNGAATFPSELASAEVLPAPRFIPDQIATAKTRLPASRSLKNAPSIDEDSLIDAFDDEFDSGEESNHLSSVMSSGSLRSGIRSSEMESPARSTGKEGGKPEMDVNHIADLTAKLQKAKQTALSLKRKGDIQGALESLRRAKQIENLIGLKQQAAGIPGTASSSDQGSAYAAKFQELEQLLVDFGNRSMVAAKESLSVNREKASEWLSKRKHYGSELEKLRQMRQNPLQPAPLYEIVKTSLQVNHELPFVSDDQIKVTVKSVNGLSQVAGKSVFVKFCLNFPSATPHEGHTDEFQINANAPFATEVTSRSATFAFKLARSRGTMRLFEIKKAVFEVWKPGTLFRNPELVARAYQELVPLLCCCEVNTHIPFLGSNRKPCGGDIEIAIQMRRPLKEKEVRLETVEDLAIGDYPEPVSPSPTHLPMPSVALDPASTDSSSSPSEVMAPASHDSGATVQEDQSAPVAASLDDPHHVDLIVSYDVMNEELEKVGAKLPSLTGPTALEWSDRYDSLALKKQLLEIEMQTGKLTLDTYVERLHSRISADRVLLSQLLAANRRLDAARVLHRIKIMEKELAGAGGNADEE